MVLYILVSYCLTLHTYLKILGTALRISVLTFICYLITKSLATGSIQYNTSCHGAIVFYLA